jgi:5-methylcytosine-specific restriction protein A
MPLAAPRPCNNPTCTKYAVKGGRCEDHKVKKWDHSGKSSNERGYGHKWRNLKKRVLQEDGHLCRSCLRDGIYTKAIDVDHIVNKAQGGTDIRINLESICKACHSIKTKRESKQ